MLWLLLTLNLATTVLAFKKRMLAYGVQMFFFLFLVIGQAFAIEADLTGITSITYRYADMTVRGFELAMLFVAGVSILSFVLVYFSRGYEPGTQAPVRYRFDPPPQFYKLLFAVLLAVAGTLIFGVVGLSQFLTSSRPGFQSGSTIFIVILFLGIVPLLLKLLCRSRLNRWDAACFLVTFIVTTGFSRIHDILYALIIGCVYFYSRWADRFISTRNAVTGVFLTFVLGSAFFAVGAIREAQNYTGGSFSVLISYILARPDRSLLSLEQNYRIGVEGMSGLVGAFTKQQLSPEQVHFDFGMFWLLKGLTQWWPGFVKTYFADIIWAIDQLQWYTPSNVASGIEQSYVSFSWLGVPFFSLGVWLMEWVWLRRLLQRDWTMRSKLISYVLIGCGIFFVRGSFNIWLGYVISYSALLYACWPFYRRWLVPRIGTQDMAL